MIGKPNVTRRTRADKNGMRAGALSGQCRSAPLADRATIDPLSAGDRANNCWLEKENPRS